MKTNEDDNRKNITVSLSFQSRIVWGGVGVFLVSAVLAVAVIASLENDRYNLACALVAAFVSVIVLLLYMIRSENDLAKKMLELAIEREKTEAEQKRREEEDRKCENAKSDNLKNTKQMRTVVNVEVSDVH